MVDWKEIYPAMHIAINGRNLDKIGRGPLARVSKGAAGCRTSAAAPFTTAPSLMLSISAEGNDLEIKVLSFEETTYPLLTLHAHRPLAPWYAYYYIVSTHTVRVRTDIYETWCVVHPMDNGHTTG